MTTEPRPVAGGEFEHRHTTCQRCGDDRMHRKRYQSADAWECGSYDTGAWVPTHVAPIVELHAHPPAEPAAVYADQRAVCGGYIGPGANRCNLPPHEGDVHSWSRERDGAEPESFDDVLASARDAIAKIGTGAMREPEMRHEGARSYIPGRLNARAETSPPSAEPWCKHDVCDAGWHGCWHLGDYHVHKVVGGIRVTKLARPAGFEVGATHTSLDDAKAFVERGLAEGRP